MELQHGVVGEREPGRERHDLEHHHFPLVVDRGSPVARAAHDFVGERGIARTIGYECEAVV